VTRRPVGFTLLALGLGWLSLGGFAIAAAAPLLDDRMSVRLAIAGVGLLYGGGALVAAVGLWHMRSWSIYPMRVWGAAAVLSAGVPALLSQEPPAGWIVVVGALLIVTVVLVTELYVRRSLARVAVAA